jgi:hypothetical protein
LNRGAIENSVSFPLGTTLAKPYEEDRFDICDARCALLLNDKLFLHSGMWIFVLLSYLSILQDYRDIHGAPFSMEITRPHDLTVSADSRTL